MIMVGDVCRRMSHGINTSQTLYQIRDEAY